jgi:hypothetical protein
MQSHNDSLLRAAIGLALVSLLSNCVTSSETQAGQLGGGGNQADGGAAGTDASATGTGPGVPTCDGLAVNTDLSCNSTLAKKGAPCSVDCCIPCGINALGARLCTCTTDTYARCTCTPPPSWPTGLHGGACEPQGLSTSRTNTPPGEFSVRGQPCSQEWTVCLTSDGIASGGLGCICLKAADGTMTMNCGTVNSWFTYDQGVSTTYN